MKHLLEVLFWPDPWFTLTFPFREVAYDWRKGTELKHQAREMDARYCVLRAHNDELSELLEEQRRAREAS